LVKPINQFYGTEEQHKILTTKAKEVDLPVDENFIEFINNLKETAKSGTGIGLASNQIWEDVDTPPPAVFVAKLSGNGWTTMINPRVTGSGKKIKDEEGCLSLRGRKPKRVKRDKNVTVEYIDDEGVIQIEKHTRLAARIIFHEYDHLQGKVI
jgi:peptide deformylase